MNGTLDYDAACIEAAKRQMPNLWAQDEATVRQYLWQTGGFCMALGRVVDEVTGAHIMLTEGLEAADTYAIYSYSDEECEGHEITSATSASSALWWVLNGTVPSGPCPCADTTSN